MYFKDKGNTDIDEELKYSESGKGKSIWPYIIFGFIFLVGIVLIYIGSKL